MSSTLSVAHCCAWKNALGTWHKPLGTWLITITFYYSLGSSTKVVHCVFFCNMISIYLFKCIPRPTEHDINCWKSILITSEQAVSTAVNSQSHVVTECCKFPDSSLRPLFQCNSSVCQWSWYWGICREAWTWSNLAASNFSARNTEHPRHRGACRWKRHQLSTLRWLYWHCHSQLWRYKCLSKNKVLHIISTYANYFHQWIAVLFGSSYWARDYT